MTPYILLDAEWSVMDQEKDLGGLVDSLIEVFSQCVVPLKTSSMLGLIQIVLIKTLCPWFFPLKDKQQA